MSQNDHHLKQILRADTAPQLPPTFVAQTLQRLHLPNETRRQQTDQTMVLTHWMEKNKWWLMGLVLLGFWALQQQPQSLIDEELLRIDTLSMSSFLVL